MRCCSIVKLLPSLALCLIILSSSFASAALCAGNTVHIMNAETLNSTANIGADTRYLEKTASSTNQLYDFVYFNFTNPIELGSYFQDDANAYQNSSPISPQAYDNKWNTCSGFSAISNTSFYINYTIPSPVFNGSYWHLSFDNVALEADWEPNFTIPQACLDVTSLQLLINLTATNLSSSLFPYTIEFFCYNSSNNWDILDTSSRFCLNKFYLYEEAMMWNATTGYNMTLFFVNNSIWNGSIDYGVISNTSDISSSVNVESGESCNCTGCYTNGSSCLMPFFFQFPYGRSLYYSTILDIFPLPAGGVSNYVPSSEYIRPISYVWDVFVAGGSPGAVLEAYNPSVYPKLEAKLKALWNGADYDIWGIFKLFVKYLFREPATLVAGGGI